MVGLSSPHLTVIGHDGVTRLLRHPVNAAGDPHTAARSPRDCLERENRGPGPTNGYKSCIPGTESHPLLLINERRFRDPCPASDAQLGAEAKMVT